MFDRNNTSASNIDGAKKSILGLRIAMPSWRFEVPTDELNSQSNNVTRAEVIELFASDFRREFAA